MRFKYGYESAFCLLALMLIGLFCSRFLISTGMIGLSVLWLILPGKKMMAARWKIYPPAIAAAGITSVYLLSGINSENTGEFLDMLLDKLPYLFIPLTMLGIRPFSSHVIIVLQGLFFVLMLASGAYTLYYFYDNRSAVIEAYTRGQILPTVMHHVSYSVLLVFAVLLTAKNTVGSWSRKKIYWSLWYILMGIFFTCIIHILATRTGLLLLYTFLPIYLIAEARRNKKYRETGITLFILIVAGVIGLNSSKTLKSKIEYMRYDLQHFMENKNTDNQLSDTRRLLSNRLGWEIFVEHPIAGVGIGDLTAEVNKIFDLRYPDFPKETRGHIHNQYLFVIAGAGIILGLLFLASVGVPVVYYFRTGNNLSAITSLALLFVMIWEPLLQYQFGNTIYILVMISGIQANRKYV